MDKVIIFDFDGTLADTSVVLRGIYNDMAAVHGWPILTEADYQRLRGMKIAQVQKWVGIKPWQLPNILHEGLKRFKQHASDVKLFPDMPELVKHLFDSGYTLYILSTNAPTAIEEVLGRYELTDKVTILKRSAVFGKHHAIRRLLAKHLYAPELVWMVGDEVRDIEAAKKAGVKVVAVEWGLQATSILKQAGPAAIAKNPEELLTILTGDA